MPKWLEDLLDEFPVMRDLIGSNRTEGKIIMLHCGECAHRFGSGCGCTCCTGINEPA